MCFYFISTLILLYTPQSILIPTYLLSFISINLSIQFLIVLVFFISIVVIIIDKEIGVYRNSHGTLYFIVYFIQFAMYIELIIDEVRVLLYVMD